MPEFVQIKGTVINLDKIIRLCGVYRWRAYNGDPFLWKVEIEIDGQDRDVYWTFEKEDNAHALHEVIREILMPETDPKQLTKDYKKSV